MRRYIKTSTTSETKTFIKKAYLDADQDAILERTKVHAVPQQQVKPTLDPIAIDEAICAHLCSRQKNLDGLELELQTLSIENKPRLEDKMRDVFMSFEYGYYKYKSHDLLQEYRDLTCSSTMAFMGSRPSRVEKAKIERKKAELLFRYLDVAEKFMDMTVFEGYTDYFNSTLETVCSYCGSADINVVDDITSVCKCGAEIEQLDMTPMYSEADRLNVGSRFQYSCWQHFLDATDNYEGLQTLTVDPKTMRLIEDEMRFQMITKETLTKDQLYMIITENKLTDLYEHINLLYSRITGKPCPSIAQYRTQLMKLFKELESVYSEVKDQDRTNSRHVNFKLYKCLQFLGHKCCRDDFYMLRTAGKLEDHEEEWMRWVEKLQERYPKTGWKYIPTR